MKITVYCGASLGTNPLYQEAAQVLGRWIGEKGHTLVYGGGHVGLMGVLADTVLACGGQVIGVIPQFLKEREIAHPELTELITVPDMPHRKRTMIDLGQAFIALPGGPGSLEEISEVISWARIGQNDKPCILLNTANYYDPLRQMFDKMVQEGFLSQTDREQTLFSSDLFEIEQFIKNYQAPKIRTY